MKCGDRVKWTSQSQGYVREKEGEIVAIVPVNKRPIDVGIHLKSTGGIRDHESYVIRVKGRGLYWPLVSKLQITADRSEGK